MSRAPEIVWGVIRTDEGDAPVSDTGGEPSPSGGAYLPQRVACYVCHAAARAVVFVSGTSYCLDHTPTPTPSPGAAQ